MCVYEIFPCLPQIHFPQHHEMSLKIYHFICYALHHRLEVFNLSDTQNCRFFSLKNELLLCSCGDAPSPCLSPLVLAHLELLGERAFPVEGKCEDRQARHWDFGISAS